MVFRGSRRQRGGQKGAARRRLLSLRRKLFPLGFRKRILRSRRRRRR